jgi:hypothetical protein
MKRAITATLSAALLAFTTSAHAGQWRDHGNWRGHGNWGDHRGSRGGHYHHGHGDGALVGLGIATGILGAAALATALIAPPAIVAQPVYDAPYGRTYYPPPPRSYDDAYDTDRYDDDRYDDRGYDDGGYDPAAYDTYYGGGCRRR